MSIFKGFKLHDSTKKINKYDWLVMGIMVLIYGIISFVNLGDTKAPLTYHTFKDTDDSVVVTLKEESDITKLTFYTGNDLGEVKVLSSLDGTNYDEVVSIKIDSVFAWQNEYFYIRAKYLKFEAVLLGSTMGDIGIYNNDIRVPIISDIDNPLTDEVELVPDHITYMNSTYFDEIYYARTAYEYVHGIPVYEWSHPPLGKLLITIPVALFGFSPFSYRLMGNIFGILLIPLMYILAKKIFKNRKWAILAGLLMMFDNFHFVHTRICLVDGIQVFFILLSVLFMKNYLDLNKESPFKKKALYLLLSGTFIGCAIATKWNAAYAALGLAIVFFVHLFKEYHVNLIKIFKEKININNILMVLSFLVLIPLVLYYFSFIVFSKNIAGIIFIIYYCLLAFFLLTKFGIYIVRDNYLLKLLIICIISFIVIPIVIYILSYILFPTVSYYDGTLKGIIDVNKLMYDYHANLDATHPFSSSWYQWPLMAKPVWLYSGSSLDGIKMMTITDIGNPAIWWMGVVSFVYLVISAIRKKNKDYIFILIFILSTLIPYMFIGRLMFQYHYFITLPFVMLAIVAFIKWITEKIGNDRVYFGYIALIIVLFVIFYPIVSGMPIGSDYVESLKWLPEWYF